MQDSATYRYLQEKHTRDAFIESTLALLEDQLQPETVNALKPVLLKINDIQRLKLIHRAARNVRDIEAFAEMLHTE